VLNFFLNTTSYCQSLCHDKKYDKVSELIFKLNITRGLFGT
jgi:hypothetical protein